MFVVIGYKHVTLLGSTQNFTLNLI